MGLFTSGLGAHLTWTLPFGLLIMFAIFNRFNPAYEEAARDLGASPWQTFATCCCRSSRLRSSASSCSASPCPGTRSPARARRSAPTKHSAARPAGPDHHRDDARIYALGTVTTGVSLRDHRRLHPADQALRRSRHGSRRQGPRVTMRILLVNPNTTSSMTRPDRESGPGGLRGTRTRRSIPTVRPSIEGYFDEAYSVPGLLAEIGKGEAAGRGSYRLLRRHGPGRGPILAPPVIGIGEAAFHCASLIAGRFSVITTLSRSVPAIEHNLASYGLAARCARVRASEVPVLALEDENSDARANRPRSRRPSAMIAARRSCWAAPAWRISWRSCRSATGSRCSMASRGGEARRNSRRTGPQDVEAGGLCRAPREGHPGIPDRPTAPS